MNAVSSASAIISLLMLGVASQASATPNGRTIVQQSCGTCHTLRRGEPSAVGPNLYGVVGRKAGTAPGFRYTSAFLRSLRGKTWTPQLLDRWLTDTEKLAPQSGMPFFNDSPAQRRAIIDYLANPD